MRCNIQKIIAIFTSVIMSLSMIVLPVNAEEDIRVFLDGHKISFDVPPQIINDYTMVPMRAIFEALGYDVTWNDTDKSITAVNGSNMIFMKLLSNEMKYNDNVITLDIAPMSIDGRTLVPLRAVSETSGCTVEWNGETRTVVLNSNSSDDMVYDDISDILSQIEEYISSGLYLEAMQLCENTENTRKLSSEDIVILDNAYKLSNGKYQDYLDYLESRKIKLGEGAPPQYSETHFITVEQVIEAIKNKYGIDAEHISTSNLFFEFSGGGINFRVNRWYSVPEIDIDDLGLDNYFIYYNATKEIGKIRSYINQGLYLEAIGLCDSMKYDYHLSHEDLDIIENLRTTARESYNNYLEQQKAKNLSKTVNDYQKQVMYSTIKIYVSSRLKSAATAIWPSYSTQIYRYNEDGMIIATGILEAMNSFGGYGKVYYTFRFNDDLSVDYWYVDGE